MTPDDHPLLDRLNPQQREAVTHHGTPLLIVAGAGSGKTRVITHRIAYLAHEIGIPLWQILAVTFTNKAAREMRQRVCALLGVPDDPRLAIGTFHSRCAMILRREADAANLSRSFAILDERDQVAAVKKAMAAVDVSDKRVRPAQAQSFINLAKMKMLRPEEVAEEFQRDEVPYHLIYAAYEEILQKNSALDFEDLIYRTVRLFSENEEVRRRWNDKYKYILVDEFQDTNHSQFELVKLLAGDSHDLCVVGDEDQSIYSWRGADVGNLLEFREAFPETQLIRLEQNYRSVGNVLKAAGAVIAHNKMRIGKELWTEREEGEPLRALVGGDDRHEGELVADRISAMMAMEGVAPEQIAVFYRSHYAARPIEDALRKARVPYRIVGGIRFYDRAEIKDLLSYMRLAVNPHNDLAFERVMNVPPRGMGKKGAGDLAATAAFNGLGFHDAAARMLREGELKGKARKGMEAFLDAIARWHAMAGTASAHEALKTILADTAYKTDGVGDTSSIDGASRIENIEEFESVVAEFEETEADHDVATFLETMALDAQRNDDDGRPRVSLMTVHNAKGLEFDHVFLVALDNGVFPNSRTFDDPAQFEEERRLFYVALTRARETVTLCRAHRRLRNGSWEFTTPSLFLRELPRELLSDAHRRALGIERAASGATAGGGGHASTPGAFSGASKGRLYGAYASGSSLAPGGNAGSTGGRGGDLSVGDRVEHRVMGTGTVTQVGGRSGQQRVYVEFDDGREQEFVLRYAPLSRV